MSVIDYKRKRLAPTVWGPDEKMIPQLRSYILGLVKKNFPGAIGIYILGSITTKRYTDASDIDVEVVIPKNQPIRPYSEIASSLTAEKIRFQGSPHVIGFYAVHPRDQKDALQKTMGAYDLGMSLWLKKPDNVGADTEPLQEAFRGQIESVDASLGELNRDMKDIKRIMDAFKEVPDSEKQKILQELEDKKQEIEDDLKAITDEYDELHQARAASFAKELESDPASAKKHLYNQTLPGNVIFKMMERYGYRDLLEKLRDIYKSMPSQSAGAS